MTDSKGISAYPLQWPAGWPRTADDDKKFGRFSTKSRNMHGYNASSDITISQALNRINGEIEMLDGSGSNWNRVNPESIVISTNLRVRRADGLPASGQKQPKDTGAALYLEMDGKRQCIPCDSYTQIAQNLAAIAATLAALRTLERHGSGIMEKAFTGFEALPSPASISWRDVLGYYGDDRAECKAIYLRKIRESHPDNGGNETAAAAINAAWQAAKRELSR